MAGRNPLRIDPSRTSLIRRNFEAEMQRRFNSLLKAVRQFVYEQDALRLAGADRLKLNFDPNQPRDEHGKWTDGAGLSSAAKTWIYKWSWEGGQNKPGLARSVFTPPEKPSSELIKELAKYRPSQRIMVYRAHLVGRDSDDIEAWSTSREMVEYMAMDSKGGDKRMILERMVDPTEIVVVMGKTGYEDVLPEEVIVANGAYARRVAQIRGEKLNKPGQWSGKWKSMVLYAKEAPSSDTPLTNAPIFTFKTNDQKLQGFNRWFAEQVKLKLLSTDQQSKPWLAKYVDSAYKQGLMRAYIDTHPNLAKPAHFIQGSQAQFLSTSFARPERVDKLRLLGTRVFEELKGVTGTMSQQMSRVLATGLSQGKNPYDMARDMSKTISGISRARANVIARTEIINAHAEGQLDAFEDLGVKQVGVMAEWLTAGDEKVCDECDELAGAVMTVEEARGLLPRHPNCRCAWMPANVGEQDEPQITSRSGKTAAVRASIQAERPKAPFAIAKQKSTWAGKGKSFKGVTTNEDRGACLARLVQQALMG